MIDKLFVYVLWKQREELAIGHAPPFWSVDAQCKFIMLWFSFFQTYYIYSW